MSPGRRSRALDGLRAIAALCVVAYHASNATGYSRLGAAGRLTAELKAGVVIFFVLSGFLLYRPFVARRLGGRDAPDVRRFLTRRAARILPAYWVVLVALALGFDAAMHAPGGWWRFATLGQAYASSTMLQGLPPAWTLCVEFTFYLALPVWALAMARMCGTRGPRGAMRIELAALAALVALEAVLRLTLTGPGHGSPDGTSAVVLTSLLGSGDWFAGGMALAVLAAARQAGAEPPGALRRLASPAVAWPLAAAAVALLVGRDPHNAFVPYLGTAWHLAALAAATLLVLPVALGSAGRGARALAARPLAGVGIVSYGVYLWHEPILDVVRARFVALGWLPAHASAGLSGAVVLLIPVAAGAIAAGALSWWLIERPALRHAERAAGARPDSFFRPASSGSRG